MPEFLIPTMPECYLWVWLPDFRHAGISCWIAYRGFWFYHAGGVLPGLLVPTVLVCHTPIVLGRRTRVPGSCREVGHSRVPDSCYATLGFGFMTPLCWGVIPGFLIPAMLVCHTRVPDLLWWGVITGFLIPAMLVCHKGYSWFLPCWCVIPGFLTPATLRVGVPDTYCAGV